MNPRDRMAANALFAATAAAALLAAGPAPARPPLSPMEKEIAMHGEWPAELMWWMSAVEIPALAGLFWLGWRNRRDADAAVARVHREAEGRDARLRDNLADYKLDVAKSYASIAHLKDVERRLTGHLLRIEAKLDLRPAGRGGDTA